MFCFVWFGFGVLFLLGGGGGLLFYNFLEVPSAFLCYFLLFSY